MSPPTQTPLPSSKVVGVGGGKKKCLKGGENVNVAQEKVILDVLSELKLWFSFLLWMPHLFWGPFKNSADITVSNLAWEFFQVYSMVKSISSLKKCRLISVLDNINIST